MINPGLLYGRITASGTVGEPQNGHFVPLAQVTDGVVLAEQAAQVAVPEKDRARTMHADKRTLFTEVRTPARNKRPVTGPAESPVPCVPVNLAISRTQRTAVEHLLGCFDLFCQYGRR